MKIKTSQKTKICKNCQKSFGCGPCNLSGECWCNEYPPILSPDPQAGCLCPECLSALIKRKIVAYTDSVSVEAAKNTGLKNYETANSLEGIDYYMENGYVVFTKWFHLKRGACCKNACRHCPFGFKKKSI